MLGNLFVALLIAGSLAATVRAADRQDPTPAAKAAHPIAGYWEGTLDVGLAKLRLGLHVEAEGSGLRAKLDSIDQGALGIDVDTITFEDREVAFRIDGLKASYTGRLAESGERMEGTFRQGRSFPLAFERKKEASKLVRPQEPVPPFPYREERVAFGHEPGKGVAATFLPSASADGGPRVTLRGTLTIPEGKGPFAAAVLVSGSGPQDRDEQILGHKPFLVLADFLARRGIAVLRCDDRGVGESTGDFDVCTSLDFADDAEAGVRFLGTRPEIRKDRIGIVGHSEGGLVGPIVAARSDAVGFLVLLAGPGVSGAEVLRLQSALVSESLGMSADTIAKARVLGDRLYELALVEAPTADQSAELLRVAGELQGLAPQGDAQPKDDGDAGAALVRSMTSPWMRLFLRHDPRVPLRAVRCPVLALNGGLDLQVDPAQNLPEIARALAEGGNADWTVTRLPGLNHLFQTAATGSPAEYGLIDETFSPRALEAVAAWIEARVR